MNEMFKHKEIIYTIYREQSFSRAAQKLFIAQPSLSLLVKKLEQQLGVPLFDRSCKPIRLTEAGKAYIAAVEEIRETESSFQNYLQAISALEAGTLGIGSNQLLSSLVLPRHIAEFSRVYPNIRLSLLDANSTTLQSELFAGRLDIVIDNHILPEDQFDMEQLASEQLLLAVPALFPENSRLDAHRLTYKDILSNKHHTEEQSVPLEHFRNCPFILMNRDNDTRKVTDNLFQQAGFSPRVLFELDRLTTLYTYIGLGVAASVVSDTLVQNMQLPNPEDVVFYPLDPQYARRGIYAAYKKNKYHSPAMTAFVKCLAELG